MADIDIGAPAIERVAYGYQDTIVGKENPSNDTGAITSVEIWVHVSLENCEVATFIDEGSNVLSTRDSETIGAVTAGSKQTFSALDMSVATGDYLGMYYTVGAPARVNEGEGMWYYDSTDQIPCSSVTFTWIADRTISLYGKGETPSVTHEGAATLAGVGTLAGIGRGIFIGKATLSGVGTLAGIGRGIFVGKATLSGVGTLASIGSFLRFGKATLSGVGTLTGIGRGIFIGKSTLSGVGTLAAIACRIFTGKATLSGTGTLAAIGQRICYGVATLTGVGTLIVRVILQPISNTGLRAMKQGESEREERKIFGQEQYTGGGWW